MGGVILWAPVGISGWRGQPQSDGDGLVGVHLARTALNTVGVGLGPLHTEWARLVNPFPLFRVFFQLNSNDQNFQNTKYELPNGHKFPNMS
jgi:hypothetical protein